MGSQPRFPAGLVALFAVSGTLHLVAPRPYRAIVPGPLRRHRSTIVLVSGLAELGCAALLAVPATRRLGAWSSAALLVAVFPANVEMALRPPRRLPGWALPLVWLRLPLQAPLVAWALRYR